MERLQTLFIGLLVLYLLLAWTAPTRKILEGFTPIVDNVEFGTAEIGSGPTQVTKTVLFKNTFNKAPFVFLQPLYQADVTWTDVMETTIQFVSASEFRVIIQRVDQNVPWGQQLKLMYVAIELQSGTPYDNVPTVSST